MLLSITRCKKSAVCEMGEKIRSIFQMPEDSFHTDRRFLVSHCKPPHVWPDLVLLQRSLTLPLQSIQLLHGCLKVSLLGQTLGHQFLLLGLGLGQRPLLLQVDMLQLCPLGCLLLQQPVMENTEMMLKMSLTIITSLRKIQWNTTTNCSSKNVNRSVMIYSKLTSLNIYIYTHI